MPAPSADTPSHTSERLPEPAGTQHSPRWPWPFLVAHRGAGTLAPENTLAALRTGHARGFTMVEYDAKLSRDEITILMHDDTIDRTSNGTGTAADLDLAHLLRHDFGSWHSRRFAGEPVPTLYAAAAYTISNGIASNIEIKPCPGTDIRTGTVIAREANRLWAGASLPPLLSSFSEAALAAARDAAPQLPRALLIEEAVPLDWQQRLERLGCIGVNLNHRHVTQALIAEIQSAGYSTLIWTVNDPARARQLYRWGCNAVVTDRLDIIRPDLLAVWETP